MAPFDWKEFIQKTERTTFFARVVEAGSGVGLNEIYEIDFDAVLPDVEPKYTSAWLVARRASLHAKFILRGTCAHRYVPWVPRKGELFFNPALDCKKCVKSDGRRTTWDPDAIPHAFFRTTPEKPIKIISRHKLTAAELRANVRPTYFNLMGV